MNKRCSLEGGRENERIAENEMKEKGCVKSRRHRIAKFKWRTMEVLYLTPPLMNLMIVFYWTVTSHWAVHHIDSRKSIYNVIFWTILLVAKCRVKYKTTTPPHSPFHNAIIAFRTMTCPAPIHQASRRVFLFFLFVRYHLNIVFPSEHSPRGN